MKLIVGIGNPGKEYENTRHNVGFKIIDNYCKNNSFSNGYKSLIYKTKISSEDVLFIKPHTYVNLSGEAVQYYANYYKIEPLDILVIHDDLDLNIGSFRIKFDSSSGGHNGIKSIINSLNTTKFCRLKIGISNNKLIDTKDYVLGKLSNKEQEYLNSEIFCDIIDDFITNDINSLMNKYNTKG